MPFIYRGWGPRYYGAGLVGAAMIGAAYASRPVVYTTPSVIVAPPVVRTTIVQQQAPVRPGHQRVNVTVPAGIAPGQNFTVNFNGNSFQIACPAGAFPGKQILIDVPIVAPPPVPAVRRLFSHNLKGTLALDPCSHHLLPFLFV